MTTPYTHEEELFAEISVLAFREPPSTLIRDTGLHSLMLMKPEKAKTVQDEIGQDSQPLDIKYDESGKPQYAYGIGAGIPFAASYFPLATEDLRIASGYFKLNGYAFCLSHKMIPSQAKVHILVGGSGSGSGSEGAHVTEAIIEDIFHTDLFSELAGTWEPLSVAVESLLQRIKNGKFRISRATEIFNGRYKPIFHSKFYISNATHMWDGSVNFTERGLRENDENASFSDDAERIAMATKRFDNRMKEGKNLINQLQLCLQRWYDMATPFEAYLKLLDWWHSQQNVGVKEGGHNPTYFQEALIVRAMHQVRSYGGSLLLIATGLGKTVIGSEVATRFTAPFNNKRITVLAPQSVHKNWRRQFEARNRYEANFFDIGMLFQPDQGSATSQIKRLLTFFDTCDETSIIIVDEAHRYRRVLHRDAAIEEAKRRSLAELPNRVKTRLHDAVSKGAKIVLLTATPYGTDIQDLNSLLLLLPPKQPTDTVPTHEHWLVKKPVEIVSLRVVSVLGIVGLLRMAAIKKDTDDDGRIFIEKSDGGRNYFPVEVVLNIHKFAPPLEAAMQAAFSNRIFNAKPITHASYIDEKEKYEPRAADVGQNMAIKAWLSSPATLRDFLQLCGDSLDVQASSDTTPDPGTDADEPPSYDDSLDQVQAENLPVRARKLKYSAKQARRLTTVTPMIGNLTNAQPADDEKLVKLCEIVNHHLKQTLKEKIVIFANRYITAVYLAPLLKQAVPGIRLACTSHHNGKECVLDAPETRRIKICEFAPIANSTPELRFEDKYDVLICTDADGVGINMEDACVVVNYELPRGADDLFQRFGRIFRMTEDRDRKVYLHTFFPSLLDDNKILSRKVKDIVSKLTKRHDASSGIIGGNLLAHQDGTPLYGSTTISLFGEQDIPEIENLLGSPEDFLSKEADPFFQHTATFYSSKTIVEQLPPVMLSAKYDVGGKQPKMFLLVEHRGRFYTLLYDVTSQHISQIDAYDALDLLRCEQNAEKPFLEIIGIRRVEELSIEAVRAWLGDSYDPDSSVRRICAVYLHPVPVSSRPDSKRKKQGEDLRRMLSGVPVA